MDTVSFFRHKRLGGSRTRKIHFAELQMNVQKSICPGKLFNKIRMKGKVKFLKEKNVIIIYINIELE